MIIPMKSGMLACGVALVSQTGRVDVIQAEYRVRGDSVKEVISGELINGNGMIMDNFTVDCSHPYVTVLTMLVPLLHQWTGWWEWLAATETHGKNQLKCVQSYSRSPLRPS